MPFVLQRPRIYLERSGTGEPLLLITGFTISCAVFEPILHLYEPHFDCIRYDTRGSGRSDAQWRLTSIPELAWEATRVLDALGVESAHVCGISMGGMLAQEMAIRYPERVRGLVLLATTPGGPLAARPALGELAMLAGSSLKALRQPGRPWLGAMLFSPEFRRREPARVRELLEYFYAYLPKPQGANAHWWATVYHDTVGRLPQIQAPTLVLHGGRDAMSPRRNSDLLAQRIPDAELRVIPNAGHGFALECPEETFRVIMEWFERRQPIAAGTPRSGLGARLDPLERGLFGLHIGALRTGVSLVRRLDDALRGRRAGDLQQGDDDGNVVPFRRAA